MRSLIRRHTLLEHAIPSSLTRPSITHQRSSTRSSLLSLLSNFKRKRRQPTHTLHEIYRAPHIIAHYRTCTHHTTLVMRENPTILVAEYSSSSPEKKEEQAGGLQIKHTPWSRLQSHTVISLASLCGWVYSIAQAWYTGCTQTCSIS